MRVIIATVFSLGAIFLTSCTSIPDLNYYYNEIIIQNKSFKNIRYVEINVEKTGVVFKCSVILVNSTCSNKFQNRKYQGNTINISWQNDANVKYSKTVQLPAPSEFISGVPLIGILEIKDNGMVNVHLKQ